MEHYQSYLRQIGEESIHLSKEDELMYIKEYQMYKSKEALDKVVRNNLKFVIHIGSKYIKSSKDSMDIISAGNEGLIASVGKFNADLGLDFRTFAGKYIQTYILKHIDKENYTLTAQEKQMRRSLGPILYAHDPSGEFNFSDYEISVIVSEAIDKGLVSGFTQRLTTENVKIMLNKCKPLSIHAQYGEEGGMLSDAIEDEYTSNMLDVLERNTVVEAIISNTNLSEAERKVIIGKYYNNDTLQKIGDALGISKQRVDAIHQTALRKMRRSALLIGARDVCLI